MAVIEAYVRVIQTRLHQFPLCDYIPYTPPSGEGNPVRISTKEGDVDWQVGPMFRISVEIPGDKVPQPLPREEGKAEDSMYLTDPKDPTKKLSANEVLVRLTRQEEGYRLLKFDRV